MTPASPSPGTAQPATTTADAVLLVHLAERSFGLPLASVERVLPMAYVLALPETGRELIGMLNLHGEILPVVDPRPRLGLPTPAMTSEQHLVLVAGATRFLLWVDSIDEVVQNADLPSAVPTQHASPLIPRVFRLGDTIIPILAPTALAPSFGGAR
jgi:chemotaxis signal transduction protein